MAQSCVHGAAEALNTIVQAEVVLREAVAKQPDDGLALYRLAGLCALQGHVEQAFDYLKAAILAHREPRQSAKHDPVWRPYHSLPQYDLLIWEPERPIQ